MAVDQRKQSDQQRCRRRSAQKRRDPAEAHCFSSPQQGAFVGVNDLFGDHYRHVVLQRRDFAGYVRMPGKKGFERGALLPAQITFDVIQGPFLVVIRTDFHYKILFMSPMFFFNATRALKM